MKATSRLLWRYFKDMYESFVNKITRHNVVSIKIDKSSPFYREGEKETMLGQLVDGYYIEEVDLFAIEKMLYDMQKRAIDLNRMMGDL